MKQDQPALALPSERGRRRVWIDGILAVAAIALVAALSVGPLMSGRDKTRHAQALELALRHSTGLQVALASWQAFFEPQVSMLTSRAVTVDPATIATGVDIVTTINRETKATTRLLRSLGLVAEARAVGATTNAFVSSLTGTRTLSAGQPESVIMSAVATERAALLKARNAAAAAATKVHARFGRNTNGTLSSLAAGRTTVLVADGLAALLSLGAAAMIGRRVHRSNRSARINTLRQRYESTLQDALGMAKTETDAYAVMTKALGESVPRLEVQMLVADSSNAHFHQTLHTGDEHAAPHSGCDVSSPVDCPATRRGHTLVFPSSQALNACPHLVGRPSGELSAACVAISITGRSSGVVHAMTPDGQPPNDEDVSYIEITTRRASERIAMLRAFEKSETQARTDPLTGLWNRRSFENRASQLGLEKTDYTLAFGDLDHFKTLNDTHGHEIGDQALRLFARVLRDSVRPEDVTARYGGEEFVILFPGCPPEMARKVLERVRERLALTVSSGRVPAFTVSFGLSSSTDGDSVDEIVARADEALLRAKAAGRNRTVLAREIESRRATLGAPGLDASAGHE